GVLTASDPIKVGAGTLEFAGVNSNNLSGGLRLKQGTLLLNKAPGVSAINASNPALVGDDTQPATLLWGNNDQVTDGLAFQVASTGTLNYNGFSDAIGNLTLTVGPNGGSAVTLGSTGSLTLQGNLTVQTLGAGNPSGATISGGTLPLNLFGDF